MACANCGSDALIKAHLIPRVFCVEVQEGKSHAASVNTRGEFTPTQSGLWDKTILCGECDGIMGRYENYVYKLTQRIRATENTQAWQRRTLTDVDVTSVLKFCAGILYKYSLTSPEKGRIDLGPYQTMLKEFIFEPDSACPSALDALLIRPLRFPNDNGVFAYRTPHRDKISGLNYYRMMMGGVIFFVNLSNRGTSAHPSREDFIKNHSETVPFVTVDALMYEEYTVPASLAHRGKLSDYLDRVQEKSQTASDSNTLVN